MDIVILCNIANGFQLRSCCKRPAKHSWDYGMCSAAKIIIHPPWDLRKTMNQLKILFTTTLLCVICSWFMHITAKKCKWKILIHVECHVIWPPWCDLPRYVFFSPIHCGHVIWPTFTFFFHSQYYYYPYPIQTTNPKKMTPRMNAIRVSRGPQTFSRKLKRSQFLIPKI